MSAFSAARRAFLQGSAAAAGLSLAGLSWSAVAAAAQSAATARVSGAEFVHLDAASAADIEAITARIIPTDDTPGAREAGVVWFVDQALAGFMAPAAGLVAAGIAELNDAAGRRFSELPPDQQDALLGAHDETPYFGLLRFLTLAGMLSMPARGGNRDHVGWRLIGFEHRHVWTQPFGHYDD